MDTSTSLLLYSLLGGISCALIVGLYGAIAQPERGFQWRKGFVYGSLMMALVWMFITFETLIYAYLIARPRGFGDPTINTVVLSVLLIPVAFGLIGWALGQKPANRWLRSLIWYSTAMSIEAGIGAIFLTVLAIAISGMPPLG